MVGEKYGGMGLDFAYSAILTEELERVGASLASGIALHSDIVTPYIEAFGTEDQKQRWLPKSVTGEFISAILDSLNWIQQWYREEDSLTKEQVKRHFKDVIKKQLL